MQHKTIASKQQGILSFFLLHPQGSDEFREVCSKWLCDDAWVQTLEPQQIKSVFHHQPDGRPGQGMAPFRFESEGHWGRVYALGDENAALLKKISMALAQAVFPTPWGGSPKWTETTVAATAKAKPLTYWMPQVVVCRNAEQHHMWKAASAQERSRHVEGVIRKGIERQLDLLQVHAATVPPVEVQVIARERAVPRVRHSDANAFVRVASVGFSVPLQLDGHWAAGGLVNRGYGRILPMGSAE